MLSLAGCGGRAVFDGADVQTAFEANGIRLDPVSNGRYSQRANLEEIVDEAFRFLRDFSSRRVGISLLRGGDGVLVVVYGRPDDARKERASLDIADFERQGLLVRGRANVVVFVDRDRLDAAETALAALD